MLLAGGVLKFGFARDVLPRNLKVNPYKYQFFKGKVTHLYTNRPNFWAKFWAKSPDFSKIPWIWLKFGKILKNQPIHIPNSAFYRGSFLYQEADFATHVGGKIFCTEYPLPPPPPPLAHQKQKLPIKMTGMTEVLAHITSPLKVLWPIRQQESSSSVPCPS